MKQIKRSEQTQKTAKLSMETDMLKNGIWTSG